jgi:transposase
MESSKAENVCEFLVKIVNQNPGKRIILILDNSRSHLTDKNGLDEAAKSAYKLIK